MMGLLTSLAVSSSDMRALDSMFGTGSSYSTGSSVQAAAIWGIVSLIVAIVGSILAYFLFVKRKNDPKNKFAAWLKSFLSFDQMFVEDILKMVYMALAIFLTLSSFALIGTDFLSFILTLTLGNLFLRLMLEFTMIMIMIWRNTTDMKKSLKKMAPKDEECNKE